MGLLSFASSAMFNLTFRQLTTTTTSISTTFSGKTLPQPAGGRKCFPRVYGPPKPGFLHTTINKHISHWQKCVDCNDSYFD